MVQAAVARNFRRVSIDLSILFRTGRYCRPLLLAQNAGVFREANLGLGAFRRFTISNQYEILCHFTLGGICCDWTTKQSALPHAGSFFATFPGSRSARGLRGPWPAGRIRVKRLAPAGVG